MIVVRRIAIPLLFQGSIFTKKFFFVFVFVLFCFVVIKTLLAPQRYIHLPDIILVKGTEAGGATVLAVLATFIARPVLRERCVEDGSVEHNSAILSNLSVALKRMDSAET